MKKVKKSKHGGARAGAGRKPSLEHPVKVLVTLEKPQAKKLDRFCKRTKSSRSAAMRSMIDTTITEESDNGKPEVADTVA
jgi:metal-responsive CopG/Arc/MetJ family transcriptional regulator